MRDRLRRALEWLGFTPSHREAALQRALQQASVLATEQRIIVGRVETLLHFRESLGAATVDTDSLRLALYGDEEWKR